MLDALIALCTTETGLLTLSLTADILIAVAYFSIPLSMLWVFRNRRYDLPYPMLWIAFVLFIFACGMTHLAHAMTAYTGNPLLEFRAALQLGTALISIITAVALTIVLPQINLLPSPAQQRAELQRAVEEATREKDALLLEINHRVGNQLAKMGAMVRRELRDADAGALPGLLRIQDLLDELGEEHHRLASRDYGSGHPAKRFVIASRGKGALALDASKPADTANSQQS
ncbi:hypothetical protein SAMN02983003_1575 [Devosia enhydra]|uniref:Ethylene receptor 1-like N-terminal domain-containing protein n=1 Tax=Devosia enhydra TaxID=665118 RepID=A0A1K2HWZ5_9HYPH|nr:hypothetical protein [Devosia enhydra]SFZ83313.1 hypothetical protein SAMN02983003_1575 [Devosia enhydra]